MGDGPASPCLAIRGTDLGHERFSFVGLPVMTLISYHTPFPEDP
jgi:hypothetical protein